MQKFLIAATSSNCGKTTFTMGLLRAMKRKGIAVQPYKCGPDYIDPMFHRQACGTESVNLDLVMASEQHVKDLFERYGQGADCQVVEGVMGLYDGRDRWHGSSAELAALLDLPIILLVNARSTAYSIAPLLYGFKNFAPPCPGGSSDGENLPLAGENMPSDGENMLSGGESTFLRRPNIAGVVFNMVGSERHYAMLQQACRDAGLACLGYMKRNEKLGIPSRHLGLSIAEIGRLETLIEAAADEVMEHVNLDSLCAY